MSALLRLHKLSRTYGSLRAVDNVDLSVDTGARHALIGCNGAGKTTLLHLIAGIIRVSDGKIVYSGRNMTRSSAAARSRAGIARTFQTPALLDSMTSLENVTIIGRLSTGTGLWTGRAAARQVSRQAAEQLDSLGIADSAGTVAGQLSHGRRRLVEIAGALAARPRLLLLDEPAAGLTDEDMEQLLSCLKGLPEDLAILLVEHHQDLVTAVADTVTVLHNGQTLAQGTPAEIAAHPEVIEAYLGAEAAASLAGASIDASERGTS